MSSLTFLLSTLSFKMEASSTTRHHRAKRSVASSVSKTAMDAINAKLSLMQSGYQPVPNFKLQLQTNPPKAPEELSPGKDVPPSNSLELYGHLLHRIKVGKVRRQTPLVNAGYAVRVSIISSTIVRFIHEKQNILPSSTVNLIFLGGGLDIMGVWAGIVSSCSTVSSSNSLIANVQVYEVDCIENCIEKRNAFLSAGMIHTDLEQDTDSYNSMQQGTILRGRMKTDPYTKRNNKIENMYTLIAADLRDISTLKAEIESSVLNSMAPTLVISELVLAYLNSDGSGDYTDRLLAYISSSLCRSNHCLFLAYEPVMPDPTSSSNIVSSYADDYFGQFISKLDRGLASGEGSKSDSLYEVSSFSPIGKSPLHVTNRLRQNGFDGLVDCTPMVNAIKFLNDLSTAGQPPELFDEYTAFWLHLSCYSIICASGVADPQSNQSVSNYLNTEGYVALCPWISSLDMATTGSFRLYVEEVRTKLPHIFILSAIQSDDQEQVRNLFKTTYSEMFEKYPSVKKLVKSALKTDLNPRILAIENSEKELIQSNCAIWNHYSKHHGAFWVVKMGGVREEDKQSFSKVLGCIGVKKVPNSSISRPKTSVCYEVNRLSVEPSHRGMGIGKLLLLHAEEFLKSKELSGTGINLIASTPEVSNAANNLYATSGFDLEQEHQIGKMLIRKYLKKIVSKAKVCKMKRRKNDDGKHNGVGC